MRQATPYRVYMATVLVASTCAGPQHSTQPILAIATAFCCVALCMASHSVACHDAVSLLFSWASVWVSVVPPWPSQGFRRGRSPLLTRQSHSFPRVYLAVGSVVSKRAAHWCTALACPPHTPFIHREAPTSTTRPHQPAFPLVTHYAVDARDSF